MDEEIKGISELEKALEEQTTGEIPDLVEPTNQMNVATSSLSELVDIGNTIQSEGVSQEDVRSVFTIIKRLNDAGIEVGIAPSLEEYGVSHYTADRTIVNLRVSQEGIGETIINVIKAALEKIVTFVINTVRYFKVLGAKDDVVQASVTKAQAKIAKVAESIKLWNRLIPGGTDTIELKVLEYAITLLQDGSIPRSHLTMAILGNNAALGNMQKIHSNVLEATRYLRLSAKNLKGALEGRLDEAVIYQAMTDGLSNVSFLISYLLQESSDKDFLTARVTANTWLNGTQARSVASVVQYEYILKAYYAVADDLRAIRKFAIPPDQDPSVTQAISDALVAIDAAFVGLGNVIDFFVKARSVQQLVLKQHLNVMNRHASLLVTHLRENSMNDAVKTTSENIFNNLEKSLKSYGL